MLSNVITHARYICNIVQIKMWLGKEMCTFWMVRCRCYIYIKYDLASTRYVLQSFEAVFDWIVGIFRELDLLLGFVPRAHHALCTRNINTNVQMQLIKNNLSFALLHSGGKLLLF